MEDLIKIGKHLVEQDDLTSLQELYIHWGEEYVGTVDIPTLFQKVYLHACLKGRIHIANWLEQTVFPRLDPIQQIALRQGFAYGRHLLRKAANKQN